MEDKQRYSLVSLARLAIAYLLSLWPVTALAAALPDVVERITPGVVAVAMYSPIDNPSPQIRGTGFIVGDGRKAITNYHVVSEVLSPAVVQYYVVLAGVGQNVEQIRVEVEAVDPLHDLALLTFSKTMPAGKILPALKLANNDLVRPGSDIAFTGFPIGAVLGLYPATHRGIVAAITPDVIPAMNSDNLTVKMMKRLDKVSLIYQLDATAYPGNSGSPVFYQGSGDIIAIINKVLVRDTKESALSQPSGISYAVPVKYIRALLEKHSRP